MSGWIRWSYVLPRLAVVGLFLGLVWWRLDAWVRRGLVAAGQRVAGAKVEIGSVDTRVLNPEVRLRHLCVANRRDPMQNLFEADEVVLALDGDSLLRRKFVVRQGQARGLRFGTERATSGALDPRAEWGDTEPGGVAEALGQPVRDAVMRQVRQLGELLRTRATDQIERLESVRVFRQLAERWPAEFQRLEARLQSLRQQAQTLRERFQGNLDPKQLARHPKRLLEDPQALVQATAEAEDLYRQLADFRVEVTRLAEQLRADKEALQKAQERDLQSVAQLIPPQGVDPEGLSEYLLGPDVSRRVTTVLRWVRWARQHWPRLEESAPTERLRGVDVLFSGIRKRPDWVIEHLAIDGQGQMDDQVFRFRGTAKDLCSQPAWYGKPATVRIELAGNSVVEIEARIDRTSPSPRDHVVVRCPAIEQPPRLLGDPEGLALVVSPGHTRLDLVLDLAERELLGRLELRQEPVELVPRAESLAGGPWSQELESALAQIRHVEATVEISGLIDRPRWRLTSNLGTQVAQAVNHGFRRLFEKHREELLALAERRMADGLAQFDAHVVARQEQLARQFELTSAEIQGLRELVAQRTPRMGDALRDKLPSNLRLRF